MENETLFNEEAEPPGHPTGLVAPQHEATEVLPLTASNAQPSLVKSRPERLYFPFKDSPRAKALERDSTRTSAASNGLTGAGSYSTPSGMFSH